MAITPDLKPDEFEITTVCPIGSCLVQHTYAYVKEVKKTPGAVKEIKARIVEMVEKAHRDGKHKIGASA